MSIDALATNLRTFYAEMEKRLKGLSPAEQQQYLEGAVHALCAVTRYAHPDEITPVGRENFIAAAKSAAYNEAANRGLDIDTRMRGLIEDGGDNSPVLFKFAADVQESCLGVPLSYEEKMRVAMFM